MPAARWGLGMVGKVALDEIFFATEVATAPLIARRDLARIAREVAQARDLYAKKGWLDDPASFHRTPPRLRDVEIEQSGTRLYPYKHLRFESGYAPHAREPGRDRWLGYAANRTAHAWLLEHDGEPRPWLVCVPGYRMGSPLIDFTGFRARRLHKTLGLNVAIPVMPLHGPRRQGRRGGDGFLTGEMLDTIHAQTQAVWDVRRLIAWLWARKAPAVAVHGVSLGAYTTGLLAALEDRLDWVIAGIPAIDFARLIQSNAPPLLLRAAAKLGIGLADLAPLLSVVSPLAMKPIVPHARRFLYAGLGDRLARPDQAHDLWTHWDRPRAVFYQGGHVSYLWERDVKDFLTEAFFDSGLLGRNPRRLAT